MEILRLIPLILIFISCSKNNDITVRDTDNPTIQLLGEKDIILNFGEEYIEPGFQVFDDTSDLDIKDVTVINTVNFNKLGSYFINYRIEDKSGKTTTVRRRIIIQDLSPPILNNSTVPSINIELGENLNNLLNQQDYDIIDNYTVADDINIEILNDKIPNSVGTFELNLKATDDSGNSLFFNQIINISDTTPPSISLLGNNIEEILLGQEFNDPGLNVNDLSNLSPLSIQSNLNKDINGRYQIIYTASDIYGNSNSVSRFVDVVTSFPPQNGILSLNSNLFSEVNFVQKNIIIEEITEILFSTEIVKHKYIILESNNIEDMDCSASDNQNKLLLSSENQGNSINIIRPFVNKFNYYKICAIGANSNNRWQKEIWESGISEVNIFLDFKLIDGGKILDQTSQNNKLYILKENHIKWGDLVNQRLVNEKIFLNFPEGFRPKNITVINNLIFIAADSAILVLKEELSTLNLYQYIDFIVKEEKNLIKDFNDKFLIFNENSSVFHIYNPKNGFIEDKRLNFSLEKISLDGDSIWGNFKLNNSSKLINYNFQNLVDSNSSFVEPNKESNFFLIENILSLIVKNNTILINGLSNILSYDKNNFSFLQNINKNYIALNNKKSIFSDNGSNIFLAEESNEGKIFSSLVIENTNYTFNTEFIYNQVSDLSGFIVLSDQAWFSVEDLGSFLFTVSENNLFPQIYYPTFINEMNLSDKFISRDIIVSADRNSLNLIYEFSTSQSLNTIYKILTDKEDVLNQFFISGDFIYLLINGNTIKTYTLNQNLVLNEIGETSVVYPTSEQFNVTYRIEGNLLKFFFNDRIVDINLANSQNPSIQVQNLNDIQSVTYQNNNYLFVEDSNNEFSFNSLFNNLFIPLSVIDLDLNTALLNNNSLKIFQYENTTLNIWNRTNSFENEFFFLESINLNQPIEGLFLKNNLVNISLENKIILYDEINEIALEPNFPLNDYLIKDFIINDDNYYLQNRNSIMKTKLNNNFEL